MFFRTMAVILTLGCVCGGAHAMGLGGQWGHIYVLTGEEKINCYDPHPPSECVTWTVVLVGKRWKHNPSGAPRTVECRRSTLLPIAQAGTPVASGVHLTSDPCGVIMEQGELTYTGCGDFTVAGDTCPP